jgi:hypothetical protein
MLSGYIEVAKVVAGSGKLPLGIFMGEIVALAMAHIVIGVYICCPRVTMSSEVARQYDGIGEAEYSRFRSRVSSHRRLTFE